MKRMRQLGQVLRNWCSDRITVEKILEKLELTSVPFVAIATDLNDVATKCRKSYSDAG